MGGAALIAGSAGAIVTMSLHPTGHALLAPAAGASTAHLNVAVHALALFAIPALFFGMLALTRRAITGGLGRAALVMHGYGVMAAMCAAVTSGFVATLVAGQIQDATAPADAVWRALLTYTGVVNRGFALVWVAATSVAILLWSAALRAGAFNRAVGIYGCVAAPVILVAVLSGRLQLGVHGTGLVVVGQSIWFIAVGAWLWREGEAER